MLLCERLLCDFKVMNGQQESSLSNGDYGLSHITKEDVTIQDIIQSGTFGKTGDCIEPLLVEPLDLRLPKKDKDNKEKCKWVLDPAYAASLIMEVDEIEDDTQHLEMEQYEDNDPVTIHFQNWDHHPSVLNVAMSPDPEDTLLIDDEGIPYTLTPDGQKVPQIEPSETSLTNPELINCGSSQLDFETYLSLQAAHSDEEVLLSKSSLASASPSLSTESTQSIRREKKSPEESTLEAISTALPDLSSLTSLPVQIMASNTGSNTPILLLPQSQIQTLTSSATTANPGILSLSLPLALGQNGQSNNVLLLLSSPQVSSGIPSTVVSSSSDLLDAKPEPSSCTTTSLSGQTQPRIYSSSPASPAASSNTSPKQKKLDTCSDMPTSFREALLRLAASAEQKKENQPRCVDKPSAFSRSSCTEATQAPEEHYNNEQVSPGSEQTSLSADRTVDPLSNLASKDDLPLQSSTSPVSPESPVLPSNHPQSQDSESLEPRRILYCQYCPRIFYYLSDLERHSITHSQTKPHVCLVCGKAFKRSSHLARHKHIHTGERNFECQLCPRRFREAAELTRHQRVHTGEKPYQCLLCHMRFAERNTLRRHTKRKHQGQQQGASRPVKPGAEGVYLAGMPEQQEENAEWYSSAMTEFESDNDTGGE